MNAKWLTIILIGIGLVVSGFMIHSSQKTKSTLMSQAPVAVAAVRGETQAGTSGASANVEIDYTRALQDDVDQAQKKTDAFNDATAARMREAQTAAAGAQ